MSEAGAPVAAPVRRAPVVAAAWVGGALWLHNIQHVIAPQPGLRDAAVAALILYIALTIARAPRVSVAIACACAAATVGLLATGTPPHALREGAAFSLVFMGFLPAIAMIRAAFEAGPQLGRVMGRLAGRGGDARGDSVLVLSHVTGAVLTLGTFAVMGPITADIASAAERRATAMICLRGMCLAILWTPFTVGMGFAGSHLPAVPLWQAMACGAALAALGLVASLRGGLGGGRLRDTLVSVQPAVAPVLGAAALLIGANALTGLATLPLVVVLMPPLCLAYVARVRPDALPRLARRVGGDLGTMGGEMVLFTASITMGFALNANPLFAEALSGLGLGGLPPVELAGLLAAGAMVCALAGLHVTVTATILLAVAAGLDGRLSDLSVFMLVLYAWSTGAMLSMSSLAVVVGARTFGLPAWRLIWGPNLGAAALLGLTLALVIGALEWAVRG